MRFLLSRLELYLGEMGAQNSHQIAVVEHFLNFAKHVMCGMQQGQLGKRHNI
jgi:hypothetical protein